MDPFPNWDEKAGERVVASNRKRRQRRSPKTATAAKPQLPKKKPGIPICLDPGSLLMEAVTKRSGS